jgi:multicomponent Na+:H+ antiporter subunit G
MRSPRPACCSAPCSPCRARSELCGFQIRSPKLHAATKPQVLGLILMLAAVGLREPSWGTISTLFLIAAFQVLTLPVAAHMIGRAVYRTGHVNLERLYRDELAEAVERATDDQAS